MLSPKNQTPEKGSFNWYLYCSGNFITYMAKAICEADNNGLKRIRRIFPQMVAAYRMDDWNKCPSNFPNRYNSTVENKRK